MTAGKTKLIVFPMTRIFPALITLLFAVQPCVAEEAQAKFAAVVEGISLLVRDAQPGAGIARSPQAFTASYDTIEFTIHSESKTGEYLPKVHQEVGPRRQGFVIQISLQPVNSAAAVAGQIHRRPYWQEYLWHGHGDERQQVHFLFKFGAGIDSDFKDRVIKTVTNISLGHAPALAPLSGDEASALFERFDRREKVEKDTLHRALVSCQSTLRVYAAKALGENGDITSLPYLIDALSDETLMIGALVAEPGMATVRYWADVSLKKLTGKDFGYKWDDLFAKRHEAVKKWASWYRQEHRSLDVPIEGVER